LLFHLALQKLLPSCYVKVYILMAIYNSSKRKNYVMAELL